MQIQYRQRILSVKFLQWFSPISKLIYKLNKLNDKKIDVLLYQVTSIVTNYSVYNLAKMWIFSILL